MCGAWHLLDARCDVDCRGRGGPWGYQNLDPGSGVLTVVILVQERGDRRINAFYVLCTDRKLFFSEEFAVVESLGPVFFSTWK